MQFFSSRPAQKFHKVKQKDTSIGDAQQKTRTARGHEQAAFSCFWCLAALWPTNSLSMLAKSPQHTHTHTDKQIQMAWGRQSRMDLGTSFRLDALIQASPALLCPQAFPDWPVEWATYPDSNAVWQGDLETDVPCHWHGADEEMVSHEHTVICVYEDRGRDRQREKLNAWLAMLGGRKEEQQWVVVVVVRGGCKRRNKSSQSNLWQ